MSFAHISLQRIPAMTTVTFPMQLRRRTRILFGKANAASFAGDLAHILDTEPFIEISADAAPSTIHDSLPGAFPFVTMLATEPISFRRAGIFLRKTFAAFVLRRLPQPFEAIGQTIIDALFLGVAWSAPSSPEDFCPLCPPLMTLRTFKAVIIAPHAVGIGQAFAAALRRRLLQPRQTIGVSHAFAMQYLRTTLAPTAVQDVGSAHFPLVAVGAHEAMRYAFAEIRFFQACAAFGFCRLLQTLKSLLGEAFLAHDRMEYHGCGGACAFVTLGAAECIAGLPALPRMGQALKARVLRCFG